MPTRRFDQLPLAGPLTGTEIVPVFKNGTTVRTSAAEVAQALTRVTPGPYARLLIYYSVPEGVNGLYDNDYAASLFGTYDDVVLGTGLEDVTNPYHTSTTNLIARLPRTRFYGYLDVSVTFGNLSPAAMKAKVDAWAQMGARGMLYDVAGYDYGVTRARLNDMVAYAHNADLAVVVNDANPDSLFAATVDETYNPTGEPTLLGPRDAYLLESWVVNTDAYPGGWESMYSLKTRAEAATAYRATLGIRLFSAGIVDYATHTPDEVDHYWSVHEALALAYGLDGYTIAPPNYSATGGTVNVVRTFPYRPIRAKPAGPPHFDGTWTQVLSPATGQEILYAHGATPTWEANDYRGG